MTPIAQINVRTFAKSVARPGQLYRARIGGGRVIHIRDGQVREGDRRSSATCLAFASKRIVAIAEIHETPASPALLKAIAEITGKDPT